MWTIIFEQDVYIFCLFPSVSFDSKLMELDNYIYYLEYRKFSFFQFFLYSIQFLHITAIEYKPVTVHGKLASTAFPYSGGGSGDEYNFLFHRVIVFYINTVSKGITYYLLQSHF